MFTASTATTLADMDLILGNEMDIGSQICILVATHGDTTPLCPSSFKEEDVLMLWIGVGQEHPEGVVMLSSTEVILGFRCKSDMMATTYPLNVATVWWVESVTLHILPQMIVGKGIYGCKGVTCQVCEHMSRVGGQCLASPQCILPGIGRPRHLHPGLS